MIYIKYDLHQWTYQNADYDTKADLVVGHECEETVDGETAEHADAVDVVEVQLAAEHQQRAECQTESLKSAIYWWLKDDFYFGQEI